MAWVYLVVAGLLEMAWAQGLKLSAGFTRPIPSVLTGIALIGSLWLLGLALRALPLGTAYAVWTGIGAVGTAVLGVLLYGEPSGVGRLACIALIVAGVIGLKVFE
jgi:quaternary ammonium compound-resistance protein SugE